MAEPNDKLINLRLTLRVRCVDCDWKGYITIPAVASLWARPCPQCYLERVWPDAITGAEYIGGAP